MIELNERPMFGPYIMTKALPRCPMAARWVALHEKDETSHLLYRFATPADKGAARRFLSAVEAVGAVKHPHLLGIEQFSFDIGGRPWLVSPYPGDSEGLMTIGLLLKNKGGNLSPEEAGLALRQVLEASVAAAEAGLRHGPMRLDELLVDRRGSVAVELYGLERRLRGLGSGDGEFERDEVRSIVEIGYQLVTALRAEEPMIPAGRLVKRLDPAWDSWFRRGLDATGGFDSARAALAALPSGGGAAAAAMPAVSVRRVFGRFKPTAR